MPVIFILNYELLCKVAFLIASKYNDFYPSEADRL